MILCFGLKLYFHLASVRTDSFTTRKVSNCRLLVRLSIGIRAIFRLQLPSFNGTAPSSINLNLFFNSFGLRRYKSNGQYIFRVNLWGIMRVSGASRKVTDADVCFSITWRSLKVFSSSTFLCIRKRRDGSKLDVVRCEFLRLNWNFFFENSFAKMYAIELERFGGVTNLTSS